MVYHMRKKRYKGTHSSEEGFFRRDTRQRKRHGTSKFRMIWNGVDCGGEWSKNLPIALRPAETLRQKKGRAGEIRHMPSISIAYIEEDHWSKATYLWGDGRESRKSMQRGIYATFFFAWRRERGETTLLRHIETHTGHRAVHGIRVSSCQCSFGFTSHNSSHTEKYTEKGEIHQRKCST